MPGFRIGLALALGTAMLAAGADPVSSHDDPTILNQLKSKVTFHCNRTQALEKRAKRRKFDATKTRQRYSRSCTASRRKDNETLCRRLKRQSSRATRDARRLARLAERNERDCKRYRRLVKREKRQ